MEIFSWRYLHLLIMFGPTILRGNWENITIMLPMVFSRILRGFVGKIEKVVRLRQKVREEKAAGTGVENAKSSSSGFRSWVPYLMCFGYFLVTAAFIGLTQWKDLMEIRTLANFAFSSFVSPLILMKFPKHGHLVVKTIVVVGLIAAYLTEGMSYLFLGLLFLQAVPLLQNHFLARSEEAQWAFMALVIAMSLPYVSIGAIAFFGREKHQQWLEYLPKRWIHLLAMFANSESKMHDFYADLDLPRGSTEQVIRSHFRKMARLYHPDKVGNDPVKTAKYVAMAKAVEVLAKGQFKQAYDEKLRNEELWMLVPRCFAWGSMMIYWLMHFMVDMLSSDSQKTESRKQILSRIRSGQFRASSRIVGVPTSSLARWAFSKSEEEMPLHQRDWHEMAFELRRKLVEDGVEVGPCYRDVNEEKESTRSFKEQQEKQVNLQKLQMAKKQSEATGTSRVQGAKNMGSKFKRYERMSKSKKKSSIPMCTLQ